MGGGGCFERYKTEGMCCLAWLAAMAFFTHCERKASSLVDLPEPTSSFRGRAPLTPAAHSTLCVGSLNHVIGGRYRRSEADLGMSKSAHHRASIGRCCLSNADRKEGR